MSMRSAPADHKIAGVVLAGGRSSRMGQNKALMLFHGQPLIDHMAELLREAGCAKVYISGDVPGYNGIPDAVRHDGPGKAMSDLLRYYREDWDRLLFVPVDMPLIQVNCLRQLMDQNDNVYYRGFPLPACVKTGDYGSPAAVKEILDLAGALPLDLPQEWAGGMANINTKEEWEEFVS